MFDCNPCVRMNSKNVKCFAKEAWFQCQQPTENPDKDIKSCDLGIEYSSEVNDPTVF